MRFDNKSRRSYEYRDQADGVLASVEQVVGGKPRGRLGRMFANERDYSFVFLRFLDLSRETLFSIERAPVETDVAGYMGVALILRMPDGSICGKVMANHQRVKDNMMGKTIAQYRWQLLDAEDVVLCDFEEKVVGKGRGTLSTGKYQYFNAYRTPIARFDGKWIEFEREVPENLRMLVIASPVAIDLLDGA
ncbi:hypothetical protein [Actinomadura sp. WMMB 499]|uniref:hypothetical protein n=1 Tax=Actinomadura sp. WMMB 499 TaxID=1219491 RepID=UPI001246658B|nr:hypothetical protein [Actinomadura sp. WMMB 499]QFG22091.1 hypothetical protein F7P10_14105 [Actinomadura sp. WMMB 499]